MQYYKSQKPRIIIVLICFSLFLLGLIAIATISIIKLNHDESIKREAYHAPLEELTCPQLCHHFPVPTPDGKQCCSATVQETCSSK